MKKYTYYFETINNEGSLIAGSIHLVAEDMIVANRMFDNLYCKPDDEGGCRVTVRQNFPSVNGKRIRVTSIIENTTLS